MLTRGRRQPAGGVAYRTHPALIVTLMITIWPSVLRMVTLGKAGLALAVRRISVTRADLKGLPDGTCGW